MLICWDHLYPPVSFQIHVKHYLHILLSYIFFPYRCNTDKGHIRNYNALKHIFTETALTITDLSRVLFIFFNILVEVMFAYREIDIEILSKCFLMFCFLQYSMAILSAIVVIKTVSM